MKKLLSLLLSLALILTLAACGNTPDAPVIPTDDITDASSTTPVSDEGDGGDSTATESIVTETVTQTVTDASGKPVTQPDGKPVTTVVTTIVTTKPTAGSGSASVSAPTYTGKTTYTTTTTTTTAKTTATTASNKDKQLVDQLFTLGIGQSKSAVTLTGVVTYVKEVSSYHGNATFDLQVQGVSGSRTIYCYRVTPVDVTQLQVQEGQTLILTGTVQNYKGTIEFYPATYQVKGGAAVTTTATTRPISGGAIDPDGIYDSKEDVALYIHTYGRLPKNYITKNQYKSQGKPRDKCCGGDRFYNNEGLLPGGYTYYECDIDTLGTTSRGAKRIVWTTSGIVYYTSDHYASFTKLYGER